MRILITFALTLCCACAAFAQATPNSNATQLAPPKIVGNVNNNVSAQAVLIPRVDARRIFGKEIAENYAVVEVNISNKNPDAALLIHGIFIDYSKWPLSGMSKNDLLNLDKPDGPFVEYQSATRPSQVASEEYRVVRGQLLDAQSWTRRNLAIRLLTLAGSLASAYTFSIGERGIKQGITAATGVGIPGVATAWPDSTIEQLNRVSDFGYRANRVVPKQAAEVIVCFFPIDRFLSPGFRRIFLNMPALFFAPLQIIADNKMSGLASSALGLPSSKVSELRGKLPCFLKIVRYAEPDNKEPSLLEQIDYRSTRMCLDSFGIVVEGKDASSFKVTDLEEEKFKDFRTLFYIKEASLNRVTVTIDGVLTVEVSSIAPQVHGVEFDEVENCGAPGAECFWSSSVAGGVRTGKIVGSFLSGAKVVIPEKEAKALGIEEVKVVQEGSTDSELHFSFKLTKGVPTGSSFDIEATKPKPGTNDTLDSNVFTVAPSFTPGTPQLDDVKLEGDKVVVTGAGFIDAPAPNPLTVNLLAPDQTVKAPAHLSVTNEKITFDVPTGAGCWQVLIKAGGRDAVKLHNDRFAVLPTPTLTSATRGVGKIVVVGTDLVDTDGCSGKSLRFRFISADKGTVELAGTPSADGKKVELKLQEKLQDGAWKVRILLGKDEVAGQEKDLQ
ncbi:MAG: hypothetical protein JOZ02_03595 [Acidobacteria bacterium]|nr:hypothetical protein [Acidobacteriota bacterium]